MNPEQLQLIKMALAAISAALEQVGLNWPHHEPISTSCNNATQTVNKVLDKVDDTGSSKGSSK